MVVAEVWLLTVAVTSMVPAVAGGLSAVHAVVVVHATLVALWPVPKSMVVAPVVVENPVPVTETAVPPTAGPLPAVTAVIVGGAGKATKVKAGTPTVEEVTPPTVAANVTGPGWPAPETVAVHWSVEMQITPVAGFAPKLNTVEPVNPVPSMVTKVPPVVVPVAGVTESTVGGKVGENRTRLVRRGHVRSPTATPLPGAALEMANGSDCVPLPGLVPCPSGTVLTVHIPPDQVRIDATSPAVVGSTPVVSHVIAEEHDTPVSVHERAVPVAGSAAVFAQLPPDSTSSVVVPPAAWNGPPTAIQDEGPVLLVPWQEMLDRLL